MGCGGHARPQACSAPVRGWLRPEWIEADPVEPQRNHSSQPARRWDQREDFLLLPGDGLILVSGSGHVQFFDHAARQLIGSAGGLDHGQQIEAFWPELVELLELHSATIADQGPIDTAIACGSRELPARLFRSDDGAGVVLLQPRSHAHQPVSEQLLMHQRILQQVRDAVIVTTAEPVEPPGPLIVFANAAALRQTGYRLEELLGRSPRLFQGPHTDPKAVRVFHDAMRHWQPVRQALLNYRSNGRPFWVEIDIAPLDDSGGWFTYWVSVQRECKAPQP
ncbi:MAG: PAS domain-containing protein [Synechococcaceae bacterium WB8_1B_136]|nr:PAS domain-containing protein [Synechococcaceae bacterium WB8_1B_136]